MPVSKTKRLLIDTRPVSLQLVEEREGKIIARGEFGRVDIPTDNKRIYPAKIVEREIKKLSESLKERKVFGHTDHPADGKTRLSNVSHIITSLELTEDGRVIGEAEILDTEPGLNLQAILKSGGRIGVSSRGFGSIVKDAEGNEVVQEDYNLITYDFVALPATETAYPKFYIEEKEVDGMENIELKDFIVKYPDLYNQIKSSIEEEAKKKFKEEMDNMKKEIREEMKKEFNFDPDTAKAKNLVEKLKDEIKPFIVPEDVEKDLKEKEDEISSLKNRIEELEKKNVELENKVVESLELAKRLGYGLYLERKLDKVEDKDIFRKLIDVKKVSSKNEIDEQIESIDKKLEREKRKKSIEDSRYNVLNGRIKKLEEQINLYRNGMEKAIELSKELGLRAYVEKSAAKHPRGFQLKKLYEDGAIKSKEDVDAWIKEIGEKYSTLYEDVRRKIGRGREYLREDDVYKKDSSSGSEDSKDIENIAGVPISTIEKLAGVDK